MLIDIPLMRRFLLLDLDARYEVRINRNDLITLNAGRYQIDTNDLVTFEADTRISVTQSPIGLGFMSSLDGLPVMGPLTNSEIRATALQTARKQRLLYIAAGTCTQTQWYDYIKVLCDNDITVGRRFSLVAGSILAPAALTDPLYAIIKVVSAASMMLSFSNGINASFTNGSSTAVSYGVNGKFEEIL